MENINEYLAKLEDQLNKIDDLVEGSKSNVFTAKVSVNKKNVFDIVDDMRAIIDDIGRDLPNEIKQARRMVAESDKIISDARSKAAMILKSAETEAAHLIDEHEVVKRANMQAMQMVEDARKSARELRKNAMEYADEILSKAEETLRESFEKYSSGIQVVEDHFTETINTIYENRKELRGIKE